MPSRIGKYRVEKELGHGGFGDVYLAYDPEMDWNVAIKVLNDPERLKYFELEVVVSGKLQHKNIVTIHDRGTDESGKPYLVMEYLEGRTLKEVIKDSDLSLLDRVAVMSQVAEGLEYAHAREVIHRDIKPENIMLLPDLTVKILDFGIAIAPSVQTDVTEGRWAGTPRYQAPEQLPPRYVKANAQTDIFSYGVVYYELLTGRHPFQEIVGPEYARLIWNYQPDPVGKWLPNCPASLELVVDNAIAIHFQNRYRKFRQIVMDSQGIQEELKAERALAFLEEATQLQGERQFEAAREKAEQARRLDPRNRDALRLYFSIEREIEKAEGRLHAAALVEQAEKFIAERRFREAVDLLESAARLDAEDEVIRIRLAEIKVRLESATQAARLFEEARSSERKGQLNDALEQLRGVLSIDPEHTEATRQLARIESMLEQRVRAERREDVYHAASSYLDEKRFEEALATLGELQREQPDATGLVEFIQQVETEAAKEEARRRSERLNLGLQDILEAIKDRDLDRAGRMIEELRSGISDDAGAADALAALEQRYAALRRSQEIAAFRQQAQELLLQKKFDEAIAVLAKGRSEYPDDTGLERAESSAAELCRSHKHAAAVATALQEVERLRSSGDLAGAIDAASLARRELGDEALFADLAKQTEIELAQQRYVTAVRDLTEVCRDLVAAGRHREAVERIRNSDYSGDAEVRSLLESANAAMAVEDEHRLVSEARSKAEALQAHGDWDGALSVAQEAAAQYPRNLEICHTLDALRELVERHRRRQLIQERENAIREKMEAAAWTEAQILAEHARGAFPGESVFHSLAREIDQQLYRAGLDELAASIQRKLAEQRLPEALDELEVTRTVYSEDARFRRLERDVAKRKSYEDAIARAKSHADDGRLADAERELKTLVQTNALDARATQMLEAVHSQRIRDERAAAATTAKERVQVLLSRGAFVRAAAELRAAKEQFPESDWTAAQEEIDSRGERDLALVGDRVAAKLRTLEFGDAIWEVDAALERHGRKPSLTTLKEQVERAQEEKRRQDTVDETLEEARRLAGRGELAPAIATLRRVLIEYPGEQKLMESLTAAEEQLRERQKQHEELRLREEASARAHAEAGAPKVIPANPSPAERRRRVPSDLKSPLWRWGAAIGASAAVIGGVTIAMWPPAKAVFPIEIRTDPVGATVKLDDRSCVTPKCRFELPAGRYQLSVEMQNYQPKQQELSIETGKPLPSVNVTLQPVPPRLPPKESARAQGTLIVQAGVPEVLVYVDEVPVARTTATGSLRLPIEAKEHVVRVERMGYRPVQEQRVRVAENGTQSLRFAMTPENAKLIFRGAPANVEVRAGKILLGRTDGSAEFVFPQGVQPRAELLQVKLGSGVSTITAQFEPGQTLRLNWNDIAPMKVPDATPKDSVENPELRAWGEVKDSPDPAKIQAFLDKFPDGAHRSDAQVRLDDMLWASTVKDDLQSLQKYVRTFPTGGRHSREAAGAIDDAVWNGVNKESQDQLKKFIADNPGSRHAGDAQARLSKVPPSDEKSSKQPVIPVVPTENPRNSEVSPQQQQPEMDKLAVLAAIRTLERAYVARNLNAVKAVYPATPDSKTTFSGMREYKYVLTPVVVNFEGSDRAVVECNRSVDATFSNGPASGRTNDVVNVVLHKTNGKWLVERIQKL